MTNLGSEIRIASQPFAPERDKPAKVIVLTTAELSECNCPEFCERDHDVD